MSDYVVRPAVVDDARAMGSIRVAAWRHAYPGVVSREILDGFDEIDEARRFAARMHADPHVHCLVAVDTEHVDAVAGYCILGPDRDDPAPGRGEVYAIYVTPDRWRTGAGRALLDEAVDTLVADGFSTVSLWTLTGNRDARTFYERQGWTSDGWERGLETLPAPDGSPVRELRYVRSATVPG